MEELTEMKVAVGKLMSEPLEMVELLQHVTGLEEQNSREAELIRWTKEQVQSSEEVLQNKSFCIRWTSFFFIFVLMRERMYWSMQNLIVIELE